MDGEDLLKDAASCQFRDCEERGETSMINRMVAELPLLSTSLFFGNARVDCITGELYHWQNMRQTESD